ncbi:uncharacterized protein MEPE_03549 [Melanopsichium pennsylvanicum]|uniref:Retrotransposon gag domain-containing protein n=1 Tax=Melanopsichium pennsylvanicum TaxID=63383 RepID=A0AAJ5C5K6_9BASI|nr:uncharacterized protein MEPE_03549 [Melanopsichium pennsylvanicum]
MIETNVSSGLILSPCNTHKGWGTTPANAPGKEEDTKLCLDASAWDGGQDKLEAFLEQCQMQFALNSCAYPDEGIKVPFAIACISGASCNCVCNICKAGAPPTWMSTWSAFKEELQCQYGDPVLEHTATVKLLTLHQTGFVANYAAQFQALACSAISPQLLV